MNTALIQLSVPNLNRLLSPLLILALLSPASLPLQSPILNTKTNIFKNYSKLPLSFEKNQGQTDKSVKFLARGQGYTLFLTDQGAAIQLSKDKLTSSVVSMQLVGGQSHSTITGDAELPGKVNYFTGNQNAWKTHISTYQKVRYSSVYPGIDLVCYGNQGQLEYDFIINPGANPNDIAFSFTGADKLETSSKGDLLLYLNGEAITLNKPVVYQDINSTRQEIPGNYVIAPDHAIKFAVGGYDKSHTLVIDPVFVFAGYIGGNGNDSSGGVALDSAGNIYITGQAGSGQDFPTHIGPNTSFTNGGFGDAFVAKIRADGSGFDYIGYIGGSGSEGGSGIAVDVDGSAYISGATDSSETQGFPVTIGPDLTYNGNTDGFVAKLSPDGSSLEYAGYIGGVDQDVAGGGGANALAVDSDGNLYLVGNTYSSEAENFPALGGPDLTYNGDQDAFVAKVKADGTSLLYAGYIGGSGEEGARGLDIDAARNVYVSGSTTSSESTFPLLVGPDLTFNGQRDAFISKINSSGTGFIYSGYIGGTGQDTAQGVAVSSSGNAYLTGTTHSSPGQGFPLVVGPNLIGNGNDNQNAFVAKVKIDGSGLDYSGYIGGDGSDGAYGIALDTVGNVYIAGVTNSTETMGFPVTVGPDTTYNGGANDAFVAKVKADGSKLIYASYIGGNGDDVAGNIAVDTAGNAYIVGNSASSEATFPIQNVGPELATYKGGNYQGYDIFLVKISGNQPPVVDTITAPVVPVPVNTAVYASANFTDPDTMDTHTAIWNWQDGSSVGSITESNGTGSVTGSHVYTTAGVYTISLTVTDNNLASSTNQFMYLVVYNPNGGFLTGAGRYEAPVGITNFGTNAKYVNNVLTGSTRLNFRNGPNVFDFRSTSYDWLVITNGNQAQLHGLGTVNGSGNYTFKLTALDNSPDTIRVQIWDATTTLVYDNTTSPLTNGNIEIHNQP